MAPFGFDANSQPDSRLFVSCVLDVQSALTDQHGTWRAMPLVPAPHLAEPPAARFLKTSADSLAHRRTGIMGVMGAFLNGL